MAKRTRKCSTQENAEATLEATYLLALREINRVLDRKLPVTEHTKVAVLFLHNYSKIKASIIRAEALQLFREKGIPMLT